MPDPKYRVIQRLEAGGMAEVFLGEAASVQGFKKRVAIKRVLPHLAQNRNFMSMFLDEARLGAKLNHANIVTVFDIGTADNTYFLVMEFIDGTNVKSLMESMRKRGKRIGVKEAVYLGIEACRGLSYAHELAEDNGDELHIVHRDVSPPNILVSKRGEVKVTDFGLAKARTQLEKTDPGVVKGKFSYLSPEAAIGEDVDARADVFAMGVVIWEMLAGRRLFQGESDYQTVKLVQQAEIPSLRRLNPDVDATFEQVLLKSLTRRPDDRYPSARAFGDALAGYLFAHQMKVTSYDLAALVKSSLAVARESSAVQQPPMIDRMILEEIERFTSIEDMNDPLSSISQAPPPGVDIDAAKPLDLSDFSSASNIDWLGREPTGGISGGAAGLGEHELQSGASDPQDLLSHTQPLGDATPVQSFSTQTKDSDTGSGRDPSKKNRQRTMLVVILGIGAVVCIGAVLWVAGVLG